MTFDDGYSDNLNNALPIADSKGVPLTVFVTSGLLGDSQWLLVGSSRGPFTFPPSWGNDFFFIANGQTVRIPLSGSDFGR